MIIAYHSVCPYCGKPNKVDVTVDDKCGGSGLVRCIECEKMHVFITSVKKVED